MVKFKGQNKTSNIQAMLAQKPRATEMVRQAHYEFKPSIVAIKDLQDNCRLHTEDQIKSILEKDPGKYKKGKDSDVGEKFSVVVMLDKQKQKRHFSVYPGHIGQGSFGKVRLAQDVNTGEWVALKLQKYNEDSENEYKILREMKLSSAQVARMKTPKLEKGEVAHWQHVIAMPLFKGIPLSEYINNQKPTLSPSQWMDLSVQIVKATQDFHEKGYYHNDIKLENFLVDPKTGAVTLIDAGTAVKKLDNERNMRGTFYTMPPELISLFRERSKVSNFAFTESSEVYQLGKVLALVLGLGVHAVRPESEDFLYSNGQRVIEERLNTEDKELIYRLKGYVKLLTDNSETTFAATQAKLKDETLVGNARLILQGMCEDLAELRPTLDEVMYSLQDLCDDQLKVSATLKKCGFLELSLYQQLDGEERLAMIETMKHFDEVILLDNNPDTRPMDLLRVQDTLESAGIRLLDAKYQLLEQGLPLRNADAIARHIDVSQDKFVYEFYYASNPRFESISKNDSIKSGSLCVIDTTRNFVEQADAYRLEKHLLLRHTSLVINELENDRDRLKEKYKEKNPIVNERVEAIGKAIETLYGRYAKAELKLIDLHKELDVLQSKMTSIGVLSKSHSVKTIEQLQKNIDEDLNRPGNR